MHQGFLSLALARSASGERGGPCAPYLASSGSAEINFMRLKLTLYSNAAAAEAPPRVFVLCARV
jgi:hypothetical protein